MQEAVQIVKTLISKGYVAYFAGGWVRDYILNHPSDDIDIATNASPEVIEALFSHTIPIGKAFGIILVIINSKQYEVATFREDVEYKDGRRPSEIKFSTPQKDAFRRDFTINGMFYDPIKKEIIDFVDGKKDIENKIIRFINNPEERIKEDRLRMIRAIRLSARFNFSIENDSQKAILKFSNTLFPSVSIERVVQEFGKMANYKGFKKAIEMLFEFKLLQTIFPILTNLKKEEFEKRIKLIDDFPPKTPVIISILELFEDTTQDQKIEICKYLKLSNAEIDFVRFYDDSLKLIKKENNVQDHRWAIFYANKNFDLVIEILAIHIESKKRLEFLANHEKKQEKLKVFIERIKNNDPIVKAEHLKMCHINPSKLMGQLLQEAEKISINQKILDPLKVIDELKKSPLWPK